jgi:hypothetical protein
MIYTIGNTESYEQYFREQESPMKSIGGSVWKTIEDAKLFCPESFTIYGVIADWENDTVNFDNTQWNDLTRDALLVKLNG